MKSYTWAAALLAVAMPSAALADTFVCKASIQDARGIATGWIATDGHSVVPVKATFVFPPGTVALQAKAKGFKLAKPAHLPEKALFVSVQYGFDVKGNDIKINLDQAEVDGPAYKRPDGNEAQPIFLMAADGGSVVREDAAEDGGALSLRLYPRDGKSTKGDIYVLPAERPALAKALDHTPDLLVAAGDWKGSGVIYQAVVHMTDPDTRKTMIATAMKKAAASAPAGEGCGKTQ